MEDVFSISAEIISLSKNYNRTLIYGDFNINDVDWADYTSNKTEFQKLIDLFVENDMQQLVDFPKSSTAILDLIFTSTNTEIILWKKAVKVLNSISNHDAVLLKIKLPILLQTNKNWSFIGNHKLIKADFSRDIASHPFNGICWSIINVLIKKWYVWLKKLY